MTYLLLQGDDSAMECVRLSNGSITVYQSYNRAQAENEENKVLGCHYMTGVY